MRLDRSLTLLLLATGLGWGATSSITLGASGCGSLGPGQSCSLTATVNASLANQTVNWSASSGMGALAYLSTTASSPGAIQPNSFTAPSSITSKTTVTITATASDNTTASAQVTLVPSVSVTLSPTSVTLTQNQFQVFAAAVTGAGSQGVTWSISPQVGTLAQVAATTVLYIAPASVTAAQTVTLTAASVANSAITATATISLSVIIQAGEGAPNLSMQSQFLEALERNGFSSLVSAPLGLVKALGSAGYVQEFADAANDSGVKLALVTGDTVTYGLTNVPVYQIYANLYAYYTTTGTGTAGYPTMDTQMCPTFDPVNSCEYDFFDKGVALFAYAQALPNGQDFSITGTFYTEWTSLGGINGAGRPVGAQTAITAAVVAGATAANTATVQSYASGAIYSITSGPNKGKIFGVTEPIYDYYNSLSGPLGTLGLPTSEALQVASGVYEQTFEGGAVEYTSSSGPTLLEPVAGIAITGVHTGDSISLNLGQTVTLTANLTAADGSVLTGRPVSWTSTNSQVVSIQAAANGATAVVTAAGAGAAAVQASSAGVASAKLNFVVTAPCCQIGADAPTAVAQAFSAALARDQVAAVTPVAAPAARVGSGYVQMVEDAAGNPYLLAEADGSGTAYVVAGAILARYEALGGPAGSLGYPASDASAGGTQLFAGQAALAGTPVHLVSGIILTKWAQLGYETGTAGFPLGEAAAFTSPGANSGQMQTFSQGTIYGASAGPLSGQAYLVSGAILTLYLSAGGPAGSLGMPTGAGSATAAGVEQNFEFGNITYATGAAAAVENLNPRTPAVIVSPATVTAGGQVLLAVTGFANNSTIRVSQTGQPDFLVTPANGAYSWNLSLPLTAASGTIAIRAAAGTTVANGSLTVQGFDQNRVPIAKMQGDNQTGLPGALLPVALAVALVDGSGAPVVGAAVNFTASPGAAVTAAAAVTDGSGAARTWLRLPGTAGVAAVTVTAPGIGQAPVTFYARAAASSLSNFPALTMTGTEVLGNGSATIAQKGALLTAVASILRFYQNAGQLPAPNGLADPVSLNQFLTSYCTVDYQGNPYCDGYLAASAGGEQIVNLWRAASFTGGVTVTTNLFEIAASIAPSPPAGNVVPVTAPVADILAGGSPVLLSLALAKNGQPAGGHFVVATGVAGDGAIIIQDPNPLFAQTNLNGYLNGFTAGGANWTGGLSGVVEFALAAPPATQFLAGALSQPAAASLPVYVQSAAGACGGPIALGDSVDSAGNSPASGALVSTFVGCDGAQAIYQINVGTAQPFHAFATDLASAGATTDLSGSSPAAYQATRSQGNLALAPLAASFAADGVVNGATFTSGIAPGGIMAIFGAGLAGSGTSTSVDMDGVAATVLLATPFQINAVVPAGMAAGSHNLHVQTAYGQASQAVAVAAEAPAIFLVGSPPAGAVTNQDNSLNSPSNPLPRGQDLVIYCTGLGATVAQGKLSVAAAAVTVMLNGQAVTPAFSGITPGVPGLYQVNLPVSSTTPPGLSLSLVLEQGGETSNTVTVALR